MALSEDEQKIFIEHMKAILEKTYHKPSDWENISGHIREMVKLVCGKDYYDNDKK